MPIKRIVLAVAAAVVVLPFAPASASGKYDVSSVISPNSVERGGSFKVSGLVKGGPVSGQKVYVYLVTDTPGQSKATSTSLGSVSLHSNGTFAKTYTATTGGRFFVRVLKKASGSTAADSTSHTLRVYRWKNAASETFRKSFWNDPSSAITTGLKVDGKSWEHELTVKNGGFVNLAPSRGLMAYRCNGFRTYAGAWDGSDDNAVVQWRILGFDVNPPGDGENPGATIKPTAAAIEGHKATHTTRSFPTDSVDAVQVRADIIGDSSHKSRLVLGTPELHCAMK